MAWTGLLPPAGVEDERRQQDEEVGSGAEPLGLWDGQVLGWVQGSGVMGDMGVGGKCAPGELAARAMPWALARQVPPQPPFSPPHVAAGEATGLGQPPLHLCHQVHPGPPAPVKTQLPISCLLQLLCWGTLILPVRPIPKMHSRVNMVHAQPGRFELIAHSRVIGRASHGPSPAGTKLGHWPSQDLLGLRCH